MTDTTTIDWKGGSRRIELQDPGALIRSKQLAVIPDPLRMNPESYAWVNATLVMGTELDRDGVEKIPMTEGIGLLSDIVEFWAPEPEPTREDDTDNVVEEALDGLELDDYGAVDVEDMR